MNPLAFQVQEFNNVTHTDSALLINQFQSKPALLKQVMRLKSIDTFQQAYKYSPTPLQGLTMGRNAVKYINDEVFRARFMGKNIAAQPIIGVVNPTTEVGKGLTPFEVLVEKFYYVEGDHVRFEDSNIARITELKQVGQYYCYEMVLIGNNVNASVNITALQPGCGLGHAGNSYAEGSIGGGVKSATWYTIENQLQILKSSFSWTEIAAKKVCEFEIVAANGTKYTNWMPLRMFEMMDQFSMSLEEVMFFSKCNLSSINGDIPSTHKDKNGKPIRTTRGLDEQVGRANTEVTNEITPELIRYLSMDMSPSMFGEASEAALMCGKGFADKFDLAMKLGASTYTTIDTHFTTDNKKGYLTFGNHYNTYKSITGQAFTIMHCPMLDDPERFPGKVGNNNFTPMSYKAWFMDLGDKDGSSNLELLSLGNGTNNNYLFGGVVNGLGHATSGLTLGGTDMGGLPQLAHGSAQSSIFIEAIVGLNIVDTSKCMKIDYTPVS